MKKIIAGVDEVGRGSLVGPVYAAAVILKKEINAKLLKDSKLLSKQDREKLNIYIKKNSFWSIGKASVKEIEDLNILNASLLAMKRAIKKLNKTPKCYGVEVDLRDYKKKIILSHDPFKSGESFDEFLKLNEDLFYEYFELKNIAQVASNQSPDHLTFLVDFSKAYWSVPVAIHDIPKFGFEIQYPDGPRFFAFLTASSIID